jgi:hypothetical protein
MFARKRRRAGASAAPDARDGDAAAAEGTPADAIDAGAAAAHLLGGVLNAFDAAAVIVDPADPRDPADGFVMLTIVAAAACLENGF